MNTELQPIEKMDLQPAELFKAGGLEELLAKIEAEAWSIVPDITTAKGRKAIASTANRVARSKTYLDGLGKGLVDGIKAQAKVIDKERKAMRDRLDAVKAEVRKPLTDWENAEKDRVEEIQRRIKWIESAENLDPGTTSKDLRALIEDVEGVKIDDTFAEFAAEAAQAKDAAIGRLRRQLDTVEQKEKQESERLAAEAKRREEEQERLIREAEERATRQAEQAAKEDALRQENARLDAERRAADSERQRVEAEANAEKRAKEAAARAKQEAEEAASREQEAREEAERREREEAERKAADKSYRGRINSEVLAAMTHIDGITEDLAKAVVIAIVTGKVPHVVIRY